MTDSVCGTCTLPLVAGRYGYVSATREPICGACIAAAERANIISDTPADIFAYRVGNASNLSNWLGDKLPLIVTAWNVRRDLHGIRHASGYARDSRGRVWTIRYAAVDNGEYVRAYLPVSRRKSDVDH